MKIRLTLFFTLFLPLFQLVHAQDLKPYKGGYTLNNLRGEAEFTYYLTPDNQPVLEGSFEFFYKKLDSLTKDKLIKLEVSGAFKSYSKDKSWRYLVEEHKLQVEDVRDRQIVGNIESTVAELNSTYDTGMLDGNMTYAEKIWLNEAYLESFRTGKLNFSKDHLTGKVLFENLQPTQSYRISGSLSTDGLMDGAWEFSYQEDGLSMKEIRRYENGFLIGLQKNNELTGEKLDEVVFFEAIEKLDSLNQGFDVEYSLSDQFFGLTFNDGFGEQSKEFRQQFNGTQLLEDALIRILKFEDDKFIVDGELIKSPIQTRRFRYDLSKSEEESLLRSHQLFGQLESFVDLSLKSNFLKLNQNSSDSLAFSLAYFEQVEENLVRLRPIVKSIESGEINYFDPTFYLDNVRKLIPGRDTISYQFRSEAFEKCLDYKQPENLSSLSKLLNWYLNSELSKFREFDTFISSQQQLFRQNQNLTSIEMAILDRKKVVDSLYSNLDFSSSQHQVLVDSFYTNLVVAQYQALLNGYNELESFEAKAIQGDRIIDLLRFTANHINYLDKVVELNDLITKLFTAITFDPFTFETEFEVIEQRNLYQAAIALSNYEYKNLLQAKDFEVAEYHLINLENLLIQLTKLRQKDTRKLERELVKTDGDINQLKKLLSL